VRPLRLLRLRARRPGHPCTDRVSRRHGL